MPIDYRKMRVLIVDDEPFTRLLIKEVLQSLGCSAGCIHEAEDGVSGLQILGDCAVDLVFSDWQMEPMDGLSFVRAIRDPGKSRNAYVPVIFCSAYTERELIERARDTGATEIMTKPVTVKAIESKIATVMNKPRAFIEENTYFGPDRRRRTAADVPAERRGKSCRSAARAEPGQRRITT